MRVSYSKARIQKRGLDFPSSLNYDNSLFSKNNSFIKKAMGDTFFWEAGSGVSGGAIGYRFIVKVAAKYRLRQLFFPWMNQAKFAISEREKSFNKPFKLRIAPPRLPCRPPKTKYAAILAAFFLFTVQPGLHVRHHRGHFITAARETHPPEHRLWQSLRYGKATCGDRTFFDRIRLGARQLRFLF